MIHVDVDYEALAALIAERLPQGSPWLTTEEAAEYMRVSRSWLFDRLDRIPHSRVDGKLLFHRGQIDEWLLTNQPRRPSCVRNDP